jgi:hypothetical protein
MSEQYPARDPLPAEIEWAREHLLTKVRNLTLVTVSPEGEPHISTILSAMTERFDDGLFQLWFSNIDTNHSRYIDAAATRAQAAGHLAVAPVLFNLYDSASPNISMKLRGQARRLDGYAETLALDVYNDIRHVRGEEPRLLGQQTEYSAPRGMYAARIIEATITVPRITPEGDYAGEGHADVLPYLRGFEAGRTPDVL